MVHACALLPPPPRAIPSRTQHGPSLVSPPSARQDSQVALLRLAERHQQPLPLQNNDYRARLQLLAARKQAAAAEAQAAASAQQ